MFMVLIRRLDVQHMDIIAITLYKCLGVSDHWQLDWLLDSFSRITAQKTLNLEGSTSLAPFQEKKPNGGQLISLQKADSSENAFMSWQNMALQLISL